MPITQDRMIALLRAAKDYQQAFRKLKDKVDAACRPASPGVPVETRMLILETETELGGAIGLLANPEGSPLTIALEDKHFQQFSTRNRRAAARMARQRHSSHPQQPRADATKRKLPEYDIESEWSSTAPKSIELRTRMHGSIDEMVERQHEGLPLRRDHSLDEDSQAPDVPHLSPAVRAKIDAEVERALRQGQAAPNEPGPDDELSSL